MGSSSNRIPFLFLFRRADEKEEGILGSILLPSFHVSMLSVEDHINRKYAFKVSPCFSSHQTVFVLLSPGARGCVSQMTFIKC